jgi:IS605 OrfB family transposase
MRSWFSNLKSNPKARPPRYARDPRQLTFEVGRNAKPLGDWTYRLTVLGGHIPVRYVIVKIHVQPGIKMRDVKLIRVQPGGTGTIVYYTLQATSPGDVAAGIDLGIVNIAAVAFQDGESILYSGKAILDGDRHYQKRAKRCKPSNWYKGMKQERQSPRNKAYRRKAGHVRRLAMHNVTRSIIDECVRRGVGTIVVGDLKGIRENKDHGKAGNQKLHAWATAEMLRQLKYKAEEVGIEVITVSERNTSKTCHRCGVVGRRVERGNFVCRDCGIEINADINGAFNILNKVSPAPAYAGVGVGGVLPAPPSPTATTSGTGKARLTQISPTFAAKFDLRNWSIAQTRCNRLKPEQPYIDLWELTGVAVGNSR